MRQLLRSVVWQTEKHFVFVTSAAEGHRVALLQPSVCEQRALPIFSNANLSRVLAPAPCCANSAYGSHWLCSAKTYGIAFGLIIL